MGHDVTVHGTHVTAGAGRPLPAAGGALLAGTEVTGGRFTLIHSRAPGGDAVPLHRHVDVDESLYVLAGSYAVTCGKDAFEVATGGFAYLPRGVAHRLVAGPAGVEALVLTVPGGLEAFFDDWEGGLGADELGRRHGIEFLADADADGGDVS